MPAPLNPPLQRFIISSTTLVGKLGVAEKYCCIMTNGKVQWYPEDIFFPSEERQYNFLTTDNQCQPL